MSTSRPRPIAVLLLVSSMALVCPATLAGTPQPAAKTQTVVSESAMLFRTRCASCHTYGHGERVGPDLKDVTARRSRDWLIDWIRSPEALARAGDPTAQALFQKFKPRRMPDHDLTNAQISALVDYISSGGPARDAERTLRAAASATADDVALGELLFYGQVRLSSGTLACGSCHAVASQWMRGGSFAPNLTDVFTRYRDSALDQRIKRPCAPEIAAHPPESKLDDAEAFAIRGYLRSAGLAGPQR